MPGLRPRLFAGILTVTAVLVGCGGGNSATPTSVPQTPPPTPAAPDQVVGCPASIGPGGPALTGIAFGDASHGLLSGSDAFLWQTVDAGVHWSVAGTPPSLRQINGVAMPDATHIWLWGDGGVYTIVVGAKLWTPAATGLRGAVTALAFTAGKPVAAVDAKGGVATSTDAGTTWTLSVADGAAPPLAAVAAPDARHIYAVGSAGTILVTADAGAHWIIEASGTTRALHGVAFIDATHGFAVGDSTTLLRTKDAGTTWTVVNVAPTAADLSVVYFLDSTHGWVGGVGGQVLRSTDGGVSWMPSVVTDGVNLSALLFEDPSNGWVVGAQTGIYDTKDGGASWNRRNHCQT